MTTTPRDAFLLALARRLAELGHPADVPDLALWADAIWPLAEDDPDVSRWAREYLSALTDAGQSEE
jgi:hypothetical protein